jgi:hypothetical protein
MPLILLAPVDEMDHQSLTVMAVSESEQLLMFVVKVSHDEVLLSFSKLMGDYSVSDSSYVCKHH